MIKLSTFLSEFCDTKTVAPLSSTGRAGIIARPGGREHMGTGYRHPQPHVATCSAWLACCCVLLLPAALAAAHGSAPEHLCQDEVSARSSGAVGNGLADDTEAIQRAIDAAAALAVQFASAGSSGNGDGRGRACAVLQSGVFLSGTVFLRPHVTLFIDRTAVLKASLNHSMFVTDHDWPGQAALVAGYNADDSGVAGRGVIDGQSPMFVTSLDQKTDQFLFGANDRAYPEIDRVRLVDFAHSRNVSVQDVSLIDSTGFHLHFLNCSSVLAERVTVKSDLRWPNNDGIDVTSCNDTTIRDCDITTGDDAISPKTWCALRFSSFVFDTQERHARSGFQQSADPLHLIHCICLDFDFNVHHRHWGGEQGGLRPAAQSSD
jgi:polygalacturonase